MTVDDKIDTTRKIVAEQEAREGQTWAIVRGLLGEIEEELRSLRVEVARKEIRFFKRKDFAARLLVSEKTIKRMVDNGEIEPLDIRGEQRFSSVQLETIHEWLGKNRQAKARSHLREVSVRKRVA